MNKYVHWQSIALFAALAALWQAGSMLSDSPNFPGFADILTALIRESATIAAETSHTLRRAATGFGIALALMLPLGIVLGRVRTVREVVEPVIEFIRPLPPIAIVPVSMIFLGTGDAAKIAVIVYSASFPILINTLEAVRASHPMLNVVARSLRLGRRETMLSIDLPAALPQIMAGIRISVSVALLISVVAEMILSSDGLGTFLVRSLERFQVANNLAGLLVIALIALAINWAMLAADRYFLAWHHRRLAADGSGN